LLTDIIQFFGTGSVPFVVAGSVLGVFELGERLASQRAKDALSKWLLTFDVRKAETLPDGTRGLFDKIFGECHFSLKCFLRSAAFSLAAMTLLSLLWLSYHPKYRFFDLILDQAGRLWILWNILVDYISLLKTRIILRALTRMQLGRAGAVSLLIVDFVLYMVLFGIGSLANLFFYVQISAFPALVNPFYLPRWGEQLGMILLTPITPDWFFSIFFWAGFAPSIWMWLYVLALFVTRALLRSEPRLHWLRWALDVEKNPLRSTGAVAAAFAFIASVAIILVSAELSRIGAAS
jgi:hypothetical protein